MASALGVDLSKLRAPFPPEALKSRRGGAGQLTYVEGFTVIRRLNEACPQWDLAVVREWREENGHVKAHVRLTIPGLGSREHIGVHVPTGRPGTEDVDAKGAVTDGLKKAATLFGVGLELYGADYEGDLASRNATAGGVGEKLASPRLGAASNGQVAHQDDRERALKRLHAIGAARRLGHDALKRVMRFALPELQSMRDLSAEQAQRLGSEIEAASDLDLQVWATDWEAEMAAASELSALAQISQAMQREGLTPTNRPDLAESYAEHKRRVIGVPPGRRQAFGVPPAVVDDVVVI